MSTDKQIRPIILDILSDGKEHSIQEIKDYVLSQDIVLDKTSTLLRNILHNLKKEYPNLLNPSRGVYRLLLTEDSKTDDYDELNRSIATIEQTLQDCQNFNWYSCSDRELEVARTKVKLLLRLANTITSKLN